MVNTAINFHLPKSLDRTARYDNKSETYQVRKDLDESERIPFRPLFNFQAREQARALVQNGEFQAAAALSKPYQDKAGLTNGHWAQCLEVVGKYFQGYVEEAQKSLKAINQNPGLRMVLEKVLSKKKPRAFHVAMRAEAEFRARNYLACATLTVTIRDVAVYDIIKKGLQKPNRSACVTCEELDKFQIIKSAIDVSSDELNEFVDVHAEKLQASHGLTAEQIASWQCDHVASIEKRWQKDVLLHFVEMKHGELHGAWREFRDSLTKRPKGKLAPIDYRNANTHFVLTGEQINEMRNVFADCQLWHEKEREHATLLGDRTHIENLLVKLGVPSPQTLYNDLVDRLVNEINSCPLIDE